MEVISIAIREQRTYVFFGGKRAAVAASRGNWNSTFPVYGKFRRRVKYTSAIVYYVHRSHRRRLRRRWVRSRNTARRVARARARARMHRGAARNGMRARASRKLRPEDFQGEASGELYPSGRLSAAIEPPGATVGVKLHVPTSFSFLSRFAIGELSSGRSLDKSYLGVPQRANAS